MFFSKKKQPAKQELSILLITLNEEELIEPWLKHVTSLKPNDIVIVDSGSTDKTKEIIKSYQNKLPIKLIEHPIGDSFAEQRNIAKKTCKGDWILTLDTDEALTENSLPIFPELLINQRTIAYSFPRVILFPDKEHFLGNPNGDLQLRLFRNLPEIEYIHKVHEHPAYLRKEIHPGIIRTKQGWQWCKIKREIKILHLGYLKSKEKLIERGKRWQKFKAASKERGIEIGGEDFFLIEKNKVKPRPIGELMK